MKAEGGSLSIIPPPSSLSTWLHKLALLTAFATFPLVVIGGLVTSKGAGLAVPDWPTTFGNNMFLYPWAEMVGNVFYEHTHRLVAAGVGLLTLVLAFSLWMAERRKWLRILGVMALALVVVQGVIGGLRVILLEETLAIVHASLAQAFFAVTVGLALLTSAEWSREPSRVAAADAGRVMRLSLLTTGLVFVQAISGAVLRHAGMWLEVHLVLAALVALHVILLSGRIVRFHARAAGLRRPAVLLAVLLIGQLALGMASYLGKFTFFLAFPPSVVAALTTSHVAMGALLLATSLVLTLRSHRLLAVPEPSLEGRPLSQAVTP